MSNALQDFAGALLVVTCAYYPLVYLPVAAALRGLDPALEETARSLGESAWGCFLRVVLPQLRPALLGGVLLVALDTLTEFGAFALLRFRTFTTELYAQYRTGLAGPETSLLALVLVASALRCFLRNSECAAMRDTRALEPARDEQHAGASWLGALSGPCRLRRARSRNARRPDRNDRLLALSACASRDLARRPLVPALASAPSILSATGSLAPPRRSCSRLRSAISRSAFRAGGLRSWSAPPIWRRASRRLSSRWRSYR